MIPFIYITFWKRKNKSVVVKDGGNKFDFKGIA